MNWLQVKWGAKVCNQVGGTCYANKSDKDNKLIFCNYIDNLELFWGIVFREKNQNTQTNCIYLGCGPNKTSEHVVSAFGNAGFTQFSGIFWLKN